MDKMKRRVELERLLEFEEMLMRFSWSKMNAEQEKKIAEIRKYYDKYILQSDKDSKNQMKRIIYNNMKNAKTEEDNRMWHKMYKDIDAIYDINDD